MEGIKQTKKVNINTVSYWNRLWSSHGGGERDDVERFKPLTRFASGSTLDVGCGFGHLCNYFFEARSYPVYGVDFSREALKRAKQNYPSCQFIVADACYLPFRNKAFDCVTLAETLEHLTDYRDGLREAERVASRVVFTVPINSVYDEHVWTFTAEGIANLMREKGGYYDVLVNKWFTAVYDV